jgi:Fe-S cluster assembly protein SufD
VTAIDTPVLTHSHGPGVASGSPPERFTSIDPDDFAVPRGREEDWRFTPVARLRRLFERFEPEQTEQVTVDAAAPATWSIVGRDHRLFGTAVQPVDRVSALAYDGVREILLIEIPAETVLNQPITVTVTGTPGLNYGHVVVAAGSYSKATVVFDHVGDTTDLANVEFLVGDGADLSVVSVQDWGPQGIHLSAHTALVSRDAKFRHIAINLGGAVIRLSPSVRFSGPGAAVELYGLSFAGPGQHQESRLYVDHSQPHCRSNVVYKSVLQGETARTVWIGDVRIRPEAVGTDTYEVNRNLLLTDGCRADSVPNLEIETGDIAGAGHASATGRFDDLQLFYLQARGIPEEQARRLVVRGFFAQIIDQITIPELHDRLMASVDARLGGTSTGSADDQEEIA